MKRNIALIICLSFLGISNAQDLKSAINEIQNENLLKAKQEMLALYNTDKSNINAFYLGNVFLKLGNKDTAITYFKIAETSETAHGYLAKARMAQLNKQDTNTIKALLEKAINLTKKRDAEVFFQAGMMAYGPKPSMVSAYLPYVKKASEMDASNKYYALIYGDMLLDLGQGGNAMSQYEEVLAKDPNFVLSNIRIGRLYYSARNYELAISYLEKANSIDPRFAIVHKELGELYYLTRQYDKATVEFKKYLDMNYNDNRAKATYVGFLFQAKEYQKAIDAVTEYLKTDSNNYTFQRVLAFSQHEAKQKAEAQVSINRFWRIVSQSEIGGLDYIYSAKIYASNGDTAKAIKYFKNAISEDSTNSEVISEYGIALFNAGRYQEAIKVLNKRLKMDKSPGSLDYYYLGRAYYSNKEYVLADTTFAEFVRQQPKSPDGYLWRAKSTFELEDKTKLKGLSSAYYLKFIELGSANLARNKSNILMAYNYLAYVALSTGDKEGAKTYFGKIIEIDPENKNAAEELKILNGKK